MDYQITVDMIKLLSDIRFRCLVFVTSITAVATAILPGNGDPGTRIALGVDGFVGTLGIAIYELRNSQLYEATIHRAKKLERELQLSASARRVDARGLFGERPIYISKKDGSRWETNNEPNSNFHLMRFLSIPVKHDQALAHIYGAALGGWAYLIASGILSLPAPFPDLSITIGQIRFVAAVIAVGIFALALTSFIHHDQHRYRP